MNIGVSSKQNISGGECLYDSNNPNYIPAEDRKKKKLFNFQMLIGIH